MPDLLAPEPPAPPLTVLWQDAHLVVVYKPAGWLVHRTGLDAHETRFVMQTLRDQLGRHVYPVHRLDKGTCGVLVLALHAEAARALAQSFAGHQVRKRYLALVRGWLPAGPMEVDHALKPDDAPEDAPAQQAHTQLRGLAQLAWPEAYEARHAQTRLSLVQALPTTGRRHQIRRHLKHVAHPIIGDATHGKGPLNRWWAERLGGQRLWLHAQALALPHPVSGEWMQWQTDWEQLAAAGLAEARQWQALCGLAQWQAPAGMPALEDGLQAAAWSTPLRPPAAEGDTTLR